jgi:hypothetical protein
LTIHILTFRLRGVKIGRGLRGVKIGRGDDGGICSDDMIKGLDEMKDDPIITESEPLSFRPP